MVSAPWRQIGATTRLTGSPRFTAVFYSFAKRHILDTKQYAQDCETTFGYFLHHDPHALRRNNALTKADLEMRFQETHRLYEAEFGEKSFDVYMAGCDDCIPDYDPPNPPAPSR